MSDDSVKFGVKWVYQQVKHHGVPLEAGQKPSLCFKGRKHMVCVAAGYPVRVLKRPAKDFDAIRDVRDGNGYYDVQKAAKKLQEIGKKNGITEGAKKILARAMSAAEHELDDDQFENEEELTIVNDETKTNTPNQDAAQGGKEKTVSKTKKAGGKTPGKSKGKKPAAPAKKTNGAKTPNDGLGREGTVTRFICEALVAGKDNDAILKATRAKFPDKKIADHYPQWYRNDLLKKGLLKKTAAK